MSALRTFPTCNGLTLTYVGSGGDLVIRGHQAQSRIRRRRRSSQLCRTSTGPCSNLLGQQAGGRYWGRPPHRRREGRPNAFPRPASASPAEIRRIDRIDVLSGPAPSTATQPDRSLGRSWSLVKGDPAARLWTGWPHGVEGGLLGTVAFVRPHLPRPTPPNTQATARRGPMPSRAAALLPRVSGAACRYATPQEALDERRGLTKRIRTCAPVRGSAGA